MLERRDLGEGMAALVSTRLASDGFLVVFTERTGGASLGSFASLNLGGRGDDRSLVVENRRRVAGALDLPGFACPEQVHGTRMVRVGPKRALAGFDGAVAKVAGADALATSSAGVGMAVFGADCVLMALADPGAGTTSVVHAGWRGVAAGMVGAAVAAFNHPGRVRAAIGPAIGPDHYEVGRDVALAVSAATEGGAITKRAGTALHLDLPGTVARILREHGVRSIERASECTACEPERFFSHRRDGTTGRQALIAARR
jgi:polyphenol oxidase